MVDASLPFFVSENDSPAKREILKSALDLFASRGVDGVSIRDIADASGFSNPAMFRHFQTKESLAQALFNACYLRLSSVLLAPTRQREITLRDRLGACLDMIEASPQSVHFVLENLRRYWDGLPEAVRKNALPVTMRRLIMAEQREGRVKAEVDAQLATILVLGLLAQVARMAHFGSLPAEPSALTDALWNLLDQGLGG